VKVKRQPDLVEVSFPYSKEHRYWPGRGLRKNGRGGPDERETRGLWSIIGRAIIDVTSVVHICYELVLTPGI